MLAKGTRKISVGVKRVRISDWRAMFSGTVAAANPTPFRRIGTLPAPAATATMRWSALDVK